MTVGQKLKKLRESTGLSQKNFGKELNLSQGAINKYENDQSEPPYKTLCWYAKHFDVSIDWILGLTDEPNLIRKKLSSEKGDIELYIDKDSASEEYDPAELLEAIDSSFSKEEFEAYLRKIVRDEIDKPSL